VTSYRDLPLNLYQIQPKFRDEVRPRFGVMRAREFIMKDAYSFDRDAEGMDRSYDAMYEAYERIFRRCGLSTVAVTADTGFMGGKYSHEFMAPTEAGESVIAVCDACGYAANQEICPSAAPEGAPSDGKGVPAVQKVDTPGMRTIEEITGFLDCKPEDCIKTLIYVTEDGPVAVLIRGHRDANEVKIANHLGTPVEMAPPEVIQGITGAPVGFSGPVGLSGVRVIADPEVMVVSDGVTGANEGDAHYVHVTAGRDFQPGEVVDVRMVEERDRCPECGEGSLSLSRGTEVGQVFKLGTKYSEALGALYVDENGESHPMVMGCYGIGVTRTLATVIEQNSDEKGIVWPASVAPYHVHVLPVTARNETVTSTAEELYEELKAAGIEAIIDDRAESPGVKFNDADLLGLPLRITVGRAVKEGAVELVERRTGRVEKIPIDEAVSVAGSILEAMLSHGASADR
jgi:prolyl-tRNA synthetase